MDQIKCIIVDDEIIAVELLAKSVRLIPQLLLVEIFTDPLEAKDFLKGSDVFFVFLDISMAELSGIELAQLTSKKIVFTTGHGEFALESWKLENVVGYLSKPIFFEDVVRVVTKRILPLFSAENLSTKLESENFLHYKLDGEILKLAHDDIILIEASRNYSIIRLNNGEKNCPIPVWELEKILPKSKFNRVNKSSIANIQKIIDEDAREILLMGGYKLRPGKAFREKLAADR